MTKFKLGTKKMIGHMKGISRGMLCVTGFVRKKHIKARGFRLAYDTASYFILAGRGASRANIWRLVAGRRISYESFQLV